MLYLHVNYEDNTPNHLTKKLIDFLYHLVYFNSSVIIPDYFDYSIKFDFMDYITKYTYVEEVDENEKKNKRKVLVDTTPFKSALLKIATETVKAEFDNLLSNLKIKYDTVTMKPIWQIPNLITALTLSAFYVDRKNKLIKRCENPSCGRLFIVSRTNTLKKYCCSECNNIVQQQKYRQNHPRPQKAVISSPDDKNKPSAETEDKPNHSNTESI